ncbi:MAG: hypothetical protein HZB30_02465 [Nitrospirae bacterium]|nr:hypothetical protein [Nitrospirota bacterium]
MTTVINFNFLNFFKLKLDNHNINLNANDNRSYNQYLDNRRQNYFPEQEDVIDVTPYSRVVDENDESSALQLIDSRKTKDLVSNSGAPNIYNRKGKTIQYFQEKGLRINSFA